MKNNRYDLSADGGRRRGMWPWGRLAHNAAWELYSTIYDSYWPLRYVYHIGTERAIRKVLNEES